MTDHEMLEMAAKAAGATDYPEKGRVQDGLYWSDNDDWPAPWRLEGGGARDWNPLTDDGDALRLAVKCGLHVQFDFDDDDVREVIVYGIGSHKEPDTDDRMEATRRAIVSAAAEIGRNMV